MPLYIGDYHRDTQRLNAEQHGAYLLLLMDHWIAGPPPDDDAQLAMTARMTPQQWRKNRPVIERFFQIRDGAWHQKRATEEKEIARAVSEQRRAAGAVGGKQSASKRASKAQAEGQANGKQNPTHSLSPSPEDANASSREAIVDDEIRGLAGSLGVNPEAELTKFTDWKAANGRRFKNDRAAFRNWLRKAAEIAPARPKPANGSAPPMQYNEPWPQRLRRWRSGVPWDWAQWGPAPGEPNCRVPKHLLEDAA